MTDIDVLAARLELDPGGLVVFISVALEGWGSDVVFRAVYRLGDVETPFRLAFRDCREVAWRSYAFGAAGETTTLADLKLGRDRHRSPVRLLADAFGLTAWYGALELTREQGHA